MAVILQAVGLTKSFGDHEVLKKIDFTVAEGERIGFVGMNGAGKSTLFQIIAGEMAPDSGQLYWHQEKQISYLKQVTGEMQSQGNKLSGGEKTKAMLQSVFEARPGLLMLDEPTNHLDQQSMATLIEAVKNYKGTVLMISHDRYFLDQCVTRIEEIEAGEITSYPGHYSWYRKEKKRRFDSDVAAYQAQENRKRKLQEEMKVLKNWSGKAHHEARKKAVETGNKFGGKEHNRAKAKKMDRRIHSQLKRLEKLEVEGMARPEAERRVYFNLEHEAQKGQRVLYAKGLGMAYPKKRLFENSDFYVLRGEKVGIIGPNGCGKTTLLKALRGEVQTEGELYFSNTRKIGYMSQEVLDLEGDLTVEESFGQLTRTEEIWVRNQLAGLGLEERLYHQRVDSLSMGERMRLKLIKMILQGCELLILDEPTNHMDLMIREQLEEVLCHYEGTLLLVSHDRYLVEKVCDHLLVFEEGKIKRFEGHYEAYEARKKEKEEEEQQALQVITNQRHTGQGKMKKEKQLSKEEALRRANRLSYLIGKLSLLAKGDPEYERLEAEYEQLLEAKRAEG